MYGRDMVKEIKNPLSTHTFSKRDGCIRNMPGMKRKSIFCRFNFYLYAKDEKIFTAIELNFSAQFRHGFYAFYMQFVFKPSDTIP